LPALRARDDGVSRRAQPHPPRQRSLDPRRREARRVSRSRAGDEGRVAPRISLSGSLRECAPGRSVGENLNDQLSQAARVRRYPVRLLGVLLRPLRQHLILLLLRELQVLLAEESEPWALRAVEPGGK